MNASPGASRRDEQIAAKSQEREAALSAIYALRRAKDEAYKQHDPARFIDQEVLVALGELERAFLPDEGGTRV